MEFNHVFAFNVLQRLDLSHNVSWQASLQVPDANPLESDLETAT